MAAQVYDVNKDTIMKMLRQDVFGFTPDEIENKAKDVCTVISNGGNTNTSGGYARNKNGFIILTTKSNTDKTASSKKQKKK